jgi:hypothetical protein
MVRVTIGLGLTAWLLALPERDLSSLPMREGPILTNEIPREWVTAPSRGGDKWGFVA